MDKLRIPFFAFAIFFFALALLTEMAAGEWLAKLGGSEHDTPGFAITYLALIDGLIAWSLLWMVLGLVIPRSVTGRAMGIISLFVSFFALLGTIALIMLTFALLMLMISLLLAIPFGTIAYLAAWGHFAVGAAAATLALVLIFKLMFCVLLVLAQQRFLENKGLMILICLSLGLGWVAAFVHALLPVFLVSIGDAAVALMIAIVAAIWLLIMVIGSIIATIKAIISLKQAV